MSVEATREVMMEYLIALLGRGDYGRYLADEASLAVVGTSCRVRGGEAVERMIRRMHERVFDATPELTHLLFGGGHAALEGGFIGWHVGEFAGAPATGKQVVVPYSAMYDLEGNRIVAIRIYMPVHLLLTQLGINSGSGV